METKVFGDVVDVVAAAGAAVVFANFESEGGGVEVVVDVVEKFVGGFGLALDDGNGYAGSDIVGREVWWVCVGCCFEVSVRRAYMEGGRWREFTIKP